MVRYGFFILIFVLVVALLIVKETNKSDDNQSVEEDEVYSVDKFNEWFNDKDNGSYANSGIFLRLDKLSDSMFEDYFKSNGIEDAIGRMSQDGYEKFRAFEKSVREDWVKKKNE